METIPMNHENIKMYGIIAYLDRLIKCRKGFITLPANISLEGLDNHSEEE